MIKNKILWVTVNFMMAVCLLIISCGQQAVEETQTAARVKQEEQKTSPGGEKTSPAEAQVAPKTAAPDAGTPKYGGQFTFIYREPSGFDPAFSLSVQIFTALSFCQDELLRGDWAKGPAGTGETDWMSGYIGRVDLLTGSLAESWEFPDDETMVFHLRKGVRFWNKPPVNGRDLTASDVVWSLNREWTSPKGFPSFWFRPGDRPTSFKELDKYTVEVKVPASMQGALFVFVAEQTHIYAPEVVDQYGDYIDWRNQAGSGPFMLTDYVRGSQLTFERNPDYWMRDPLHPDNQLPYLDRLKQLVITDYSTQLAAFRTGKIDFMGMWPNVPWEDAKKLMEFAPALQYKVVTGSDKQIWFRIDKQDLPFKDVKVRQALNLAVNQPEIVDTYYQGNAALLGHPYPPFKTWEPLYTPLEEMPEAVRELFAYDPEKAKELLAEAGYPGGFKTEIAVLAGPDSDFLSLIREYFLKVGVDMKIVPIESGAFAGVNRGRKYEQMIYTGSPTSVFPYTMPSVIIETLDDKSYYENPKTRAVFNEVNLYFGKDDAKWMKLLKDITPFVLEESVGVWLPVPYQYRMWWPWVQNYQGEGSLGYDNQMAITHHIWVDENLKKSMGY